VPLFDRSSTDLGKYTLVIALVSNSDANLILGHYQLVVHLYDAACELSTNWTPYVADPKTMQLGTNSAGTLTIAAAS
jgi:hypothetical protein